MPTTEIERVATSQLVRWCPVGRAWELDDGTRPFACSGCDPVHWLRLCRMFICSICEQCNATKEGFDSHDCFDAY